MMLTEEPDYQRNKAWKTDSLAEENINRNGFGGGDQRTGDSAGQDYDSEGG